MGNVNFLLNFLVYLEFYQVDPKNISKIAKLARIKVSNNEAQNLATDLTKIFDWIEQLNEVNTENVIPMTSVTEMAMLSRKDEITDINNIDLIFSNTLDMPEDGRKFFTVPKVIE